MSDSKSSKIGYGIVVACAILLVYSIASTSVLWVEPTGFGLASKLPLTYWIGLGLLGYLWYIGRESRNYLITALILTVGYLYIAPSLIRIPVWQSYSFYPFGESVLINLNGHLVDRSSAILISYLDWPIFLYFASGFTLITGIPHTILLKAFPLLTVALYGLLAVLILRTKLKLTHSIVGAAWLLGIFFIRQQYFGPQSIAYIFFLLILLIVSWLFFEKRANEKILIGLLFFLFLLATFAHPLTSLMSLIVIVALYLGRLVLRKQSAIIFQLLLLSALIWVGYNMYFAPGFFNLVVRDYSEIVFGNRDLGLYSEPSRIIGSDAMLLNFTSSWAIVILCVAAALVPTFQAIRNARSKEKTSEMEYSLFFAVLLVMLGTFAFAAEYGVHEGYQRAFMFGLVPLSYLCVKLLGRKPRILIVFLVGLLFLNIPAQYGADTYRLATESQITGTAFVADHTPQNLSLLGRFSLYIRYHDPPKNIEVSGIGIPYPYTAPYNSSAVDEAVNAALKNGDYVMLSDMQGNFYEFYLGSDPLENINFDESCNRVYDNWRLRLYKPANTTSQP